MRTIFVFAYFVNLCCVICKCEKPKNYQPSWNYKVFWCEKNWTVIQKGGKIDFWI